MKINQIEVVINAHEEIIIRQGYTNCQVVRLTADQADMVAEEIKRLAKQLKEEANGKE